MCPDRFTVTVVAAVIAASSMIPQHRVGAVAQGAFIRRITARFQTTCLRWCGGAPAQQLQRLAQQYRATPPFAPRPLLNALLHPLPASHTTSSNCVGRRPKTFHMNGQSCGVLCVSRSLQGYHSPATAWCRCVGCPPPPSSHPHTLSGDVCQILRASYQLPNSLSPATIAHSPESYQAHITTSTPLPLTALSITAPRCAQGERASGDLFPYAFHLHTHNDTHNNTHTGSLTGCWCSQTCCICCIRQGRCLAGAAPVVATTATSALGSKCPRPQ